MRMCNFIWHAVAMTINFALGRERKRERKILLFMTECGLLSLSGEGGALARRHLQWSTARGNSVAYLMAFTFKPFSAWFSLETKRCRYIYKSQAIPAPIQLLLNSIFQEQIAGAVELEAPPTPFSTIHTYTNILSSLFFLFPMHAVLGSGMLQLILPR